MSNRHGHHWIRDAKRQAIYARDGMRCVYCGAQFMRQHVEPEPGIIYAKTATLDHLQPRELGGSNHETNLVSACCTCNSSRQCLSLRDWMARLRTLGVDTTKICRRIRMLVKKPLR